MASALLLCLGCALAEETWTAEDEAEWLAQLPVEGGLICDVWDEPDLGKAAIVYGYALEPGQTVLYIPPELGGRPSHMQQDELMWIYISTFDYARGNFLQRPYNVVCAAELPQEINGRRVIFPRYLNDLAVTSGDWQYVREHDGSAVIWAYAGESIPEEVTIPGQIDGCRVYAFVSSNMPEGASVVYDPAMQVLDYSR